jgi:hypothetical protein
MSLSRADLNVVIKEMFPDGVDMSLHMKQHPLLGLIERDNEFDGRYWQVPIKRSNPASRSYTLSNAITNERNSKYSAFAVTPITDYQVAYIDGIVLRASNGKSMNSAIKVIQTELDGAIYNVTNNIARSAYAASAARGQVHPSTAISGTSLTLAYPSQARFFQEGMVIQGSATQSGGSVLPGSVTIVSVNEDTGVLVGSANWSTITGLTNSNWLFMSGDYGFGPAGLGAWCPLTAPSATAFFGVDRTVSPNLLAGIRVDTSGESIETFLIKTYARCQAAAFKPDLVLMHPYDSARLEKAKEGQRFDVKSGVYDVGFDGFRAYGSTIVEDADCPEGQFFALDKSAFKWLVASKDQPGIFDDDGEYRASATADSYEVRLGADFNFAAFNPGKIATGSVPTI